MSTGEDKLSIKSLEKGLTCLTTFSRQKPALTLSQMAKANGMNLPTARRYLHTLSKLGYVHHDEESKTYQLTSKVLRLGYWVIDSMGIKQRMLPYLNAICREFNITTATSILEGNEVLIIERLRSTDVVNLDLTAGSRLPIHNTSMGKAIAAFLPEEELEELLLNVDYTRYTPFTKVEQESLRRELRQTRRRGYARSDQELTLGMKSMAVPIFDTQGKVEASLGVSYPSRRTEEPGLEESVLDRIKEVSGKTSGALPIGMK